MLATYITTMTALIPLYCRSSFMSTTIRLVFWVFGDDCDRTTSVRITLDKDIGDLKEAIKEKKKLAFEHVDAHALDLWKVSIPFDEDFEQNLDALDMTQRPLPGRRKLSSLFSQKPDDCLDVVVKVPDGELNFFPVDCHLTLKSEPACRSSQSLFAHTDRLTYDVHALAQLLCSWR